MSERMQADPYTIRVLEDVYSKLEKLEKEWRAHKETEEAAEQKLKAAYEEARAKQMAAEAKDEQSMISHCKEIIESF